MGRDPKGETWSLHKVEGNEDPSILVLTMSDPVQ